VQKSIVQAKAFFRFAGWISHTQVIPLGFASGMLRKRKPLGNQKQNHL
jgi:hypothetical protein